MLQIKRAYVCTCREASAGVLSRWLSRSNQSSAWRRVAARTWTTVVRSLTHGVGAISANQPQSSVISLTQRPAPLRVSSAMNTADDLVSKPHIDCHFHQINLQKITAPTETAANAVILI